MHKKYTEKSIRKYLKTSGLTFRIFDELPSTNTYVRTLNEDGAPEGTVVLARMQTAGRGRKGHEFYSPKDTGIYMSVLLRPSLPISDALRITTAAAVAVAETVRSVTGRNAEIKWVNDIYLDGKKVCGILTESAVNPDGRTLSYAILGIGINVLSPESDFPAEIQSIAAPISEKDEKDLHARIISGVLDRFFTLYENLQSPALLQKYKSLSCLLGQECYIVGKEDLHGTAVDIDEDFRLILEQNGKRIALDSGEVSVRSK